MISKKIIATYARVSTAKQEEEQTIKNQTEAFKEYAQKNGCIIAKEYNDEGWSGDILARPGLDTLRQEAKAKIWEAVLIYDPDRLARRYSFQELVLDELREAGIEIIFITVSSPKNSEDKILHGVRGLFAEYERAKISERFRLGKLRKLKEGHILITEPKYGYTYIRKKENTHGYYVINEEEAKVVKMIFEQVADGMTLKKVVKHLQDLNIKPRKSKRGVWNASTLGTLLRHKIYIGEAHWGKSYAIIPEKPFKIEKYKKLRKTSRKIRPEDEWYKVSVPAIISKELFEKTGQQLRLNYERSNRNKKSEYLLSGKMYCKCGIKRCGEGPQKGKYLYYRCANRTYHYPLPPTCHEKGINARIADVLEWQKIVALMSSAELLLNQIARTMKIKQINTEEVTIDILPLNKEIHKLKIEEERYNKAYGAGVFTLEQLREYTLSIKEKIISIKNQITQAEQRGSYTKEILPTEAEIKDYTEHALEYLSDLNFIQKRAIIEYVVDKIIGTPLELQVIGHIPISSHVKLQTIHRNSEDTTQQKLIPFEFTISLPLPKQRGIDYGFGAKKLKNLSL
jgi:site-specific DNA recombinase